MRYFHIRRLYFVNVCLHFDFVVCCLSLPLSQSLLRCSVSVCVCVGGILLSSVETPISRTSRPPEGHSQSFGVRKEGGLGRSEAALRVTGLNSHLDPGVLTQ